MIARFPRNDEIATAARRELALLPELAQHVDFLVPLPSHHGVWSDRPFFVYPRIPGRAISRSDASPEVFAVLRRMLSDLQDFPVDRATELLGTGLPQQDWRNHFERLWPVIENLALPAIDVPLANLVKKEFGRFMDTPFDFPYCLVHNDLGPEHVLVDEKTTLPIGLIDFESALVGDPAIDFVGLGAFFEAEGLDQLIEKRDLGERLAERMWFYRWMGSVHAVIYGVREHNEEELVAGASELQRRLDARP